MSDKPLDRQMLHDQINEAWDLVERVDSPEAEALRGVLGVSAFRFLDNAAMGRRPDDRDGIVLIVQAAIARDYLYAVRHGEPSRKINGALLMLAWQDLSDAERNELGLRCCHGCGSLDTRCQCWNDS